MHAYICFGKTILSEFALPLEERSTLGPPDISVILNPSLSHDSRACPEQPAFKIGDDALLVSYAGAGTFRLTPSAKTIEVAPIAATPARLSLPYVTTNLIAVLQGLSDERLILHGSTVSLPHGQVLIMGESGAGKSTLTLRLLQDGYALVSDDIAVINQQTKAFVERGAPYTKVFEDSLERLNIASDNHPLLGEGSLKRIVAFTPALKKQILHRIYILEPSQDVGQEPLSHVHAFEHLVRHSFLPRSIDLLGNQKNHFSRVSRLLSGTPVYRITRTHDFDSLDACAALISAATSP